jgi:hypothetical protein
MPERRCGVEGCRNPVNSKGLCRKHYARWTKYRDVNTIGKRGRPFRFTKAVEDKVRELIGKGIHVDQIADFLKVSSAYVLEPRRLRERTHLRWI